MFDAVLGHGNIPKRRFGTGAAISVLVHAGVVAFAVWAAAHPQEVYKSDVSVTFMKPPPSPPPPPPPAAPKHARPKPKPTEPRTVLAQAIVAPTEIPTEKPPEQEPTRDDSDHHGDGADGGEVGGVPGGIVGGVIDAADAAEPPPPPKRLEFNDTMVRPEYLSGPSPEYTEKALEREVEGVMVVKCVVTADGRVHDCRVLKSLPFMDNAVVSALERRRYKPATSGGKVVEVNYTFNIKLTLPR